MLFRSIGGIGAALIGVTVIVGSIAASGAFDGNNNSSTNNGSGL